MLFSFEYRAGSIVLTKHDMRERERERERGCIDIIDKEWYSSLVISKWWYRWSTVGGRCATCCNGYMNVEITANDSVICVETILKMTNVGTTLSRQCIANV